MHQDSSFLRWLFLLLIPCLLFPGALPGDKVVSAAEHLQVHQAFSQGLAVEPHHPELSDPAMLLLPLRAKVLTSLRRFEAPLWNPDIYAGSPLLADGQSMVFSPVTWLGLLFPPAMAQDLGVWWLFVWTGIGTLLLAQSMAIKRWAGVLTACAAMTSPYLYVWLLHPNAAVYCWLPWMLWCVEKPKPLRLAICTAAMIGGGHPGTILHCFMAVAGWWILRKPTKDTPIGLVLGILLAAPIWLPLAEFSLLSESLQARGGNTLPSAALLNLVWPFYWGHPASGDWQGQGMWSEWQLHPGLAVLALAGIGLLQTRTKQQSRLLIGLWIFCLLLAIIGLPGPVNHARLGCFGAFFLGLAAGHSVNHWRDSYIFLGIGMILLTGAWGRSLDQFSIDQSYHNAKPAQWTQEVRRTLGCSHPDDHCGRVIALESILQPNTGSLVGLRDLRGYDLPVSRATRRLMAALNPQPQSPWFPIDTLPAQGLLLFSGVRLVLQSSTTGSTDYNFTNTSITTKEIDLQAPRAWLSSGAFAVPNAQLALDYINQTQDTRGRPPVEGLTNDLPGNTWKPLQLTEHGYNQLEINIHGQDEGLLVLADTWSPGWQATIDEQPAEILRVGGYFRGLLVHKSTGSQNRIVRFIYRPAGWIWGKRLAAGGVILWLLMGGLRYGRQNLLD